MEDLREFYFKQRHQVEQLFNQVADELALKDMNKGVDVSYVPKNRAVWREMIKKLDEAYTEKTEPVKAKQRNV